MYAWNLLIYTTGLFNPGEIGNFLDDDLPKKEHFSSSEGNLAHLHTSAYLPDSHSDLYPLLDWSCPISFARWVEIVLIKVKVHCTGSHPIGIGCCGENLSTQSDHHHNPDCHCHPCPSFPFQDMGVLLGSESVHNECLGINWKKNVFFWALPK